MALNKHVSIYFLFPDIIIVHLIILILNCFIFSQISTIILQFSKLRMLEKEDTGDETFPYFPTLGQAE